MKWLTFVLAVAYDWRLAVRAIRSVYHVAHEIIVGWDAAGRTWNGDQFLEFERYDFLREVTAALPHVEVPEILERVRTVAGCFWAPGRTRQELQSQQRSALTHLARPGGWILRLDADEELLDPETFAASLPDPRPGLGVTAEYLSVYKVIGDVALVFDSRRRFPVGQCEPGGHIDAATRAQEWFPAAGRVLHWTMARGEEELWLKLQAMSEATFAPQLIFDCWRATTLQNFTDGIHPGSCYAPETPLRAVPLAMLRTEARP